MEDMIVSDCCGVEMDGILMDHGICPDCGEHCEAVSYDSEPDHISGYEDDDMRAAREELENMSIEEYNSLPEYKGNK